MKSMVNETTVQKQLALRVAESGAKAGALFTKKPQQQTEIGAGATIKRLALRPTNQAGAIGTPKLRIPSSATKSCQKPLCDDAKCAKAEKQCGGVKPPATSGQKAMQKQLFSPVELPKTEETIVSESICGASEICIPKHVAPQSDAMPSDSNVRDGKLDLKSELEQAKDESGSETDDENEHGPPMSYYFAEPDAGESFFSADSAALQSHSSTLPNLSFASQNANRYTAWDSWNAALFQDSALDETRMTDYVKALLTHFAVRRMPGDGGYACAFGESTAHERGHVGANWRWHLFERSKASGSAAEIREAPFRSWDSDENPLVTNILELARTGSDVHVDFLGDDCLTSPTELSKIFAIADEHHEELLENFSFSDSYLLHADEIESD